MGATATTCALQAKIRGWHGERQTVAALPGIPLCKAKFRARLTSIAHWPRAVRSRWLDAASGNARSCFVRRR